MTIPQYTEESLDKLLNRDLIPIVLSLEANEKKKYQYQTAQSFQEFYHNLYYF